MNFESNPPLRLLQTWAALYPQQQPQWLLQAPEREMWVAAIAIAGHAYHLHNADNDAATVFDRHSAKRKRTLTNRPLPHWARYPAGVILHLSRTGLTIGGMGFVLAGNEPPGPRYDYASALALAVLIYTCHDRPYTVEQLLALVDAVRREYMA